MDERLLRSLVLKRVLGPRTGGILSSHRTKLHRVLAFLLAGFYCRLPIFKGRVFFLHGRHKVGNFYAGGF